MAGQTVCYDIIKRIREGIPSDSELKTKYLQDQYRKIHGHPCFYEVTGEITSILTDTGSPTEFSRFCKGIDTPEKIIRIVLNEIDNRMSTHDYPRVSALIKHILPFGQQPWPEKEGANSFLSFRDLIEYTYYMATCEFGEEVTIGPFLQTDILYHYGQLLCKTREYEQALPVLQEAERQNPVHAGILAELAEVLIRTSHQDQAQTLLQRSFSCAWVREDLVHAYQVQGLFFSLSGDYEAAISCYLIAETWDDSAYRREKIEALAQYAEHEIESGYYNEHGREILISHDLPYGPNPDIVSLIVEIADDYLDDHDFFKAREYLIRAHMLLMNDELEERIWRIEQFIDDQMDF
ncbi:MAG TPA: tetratricopeptide repeat protein [Methanospirillum sp.]|nr:tetratricopeptide repeat protein [Methanospirillum sp.]